MLSYRNEATILAAVDSILAQGEACEVVVSHSGGGPVPALLTTARPSVRVITSPERRLPGAARNAGVAASSAPYVAFLAGDCVAAPGWVDGRLRRHRSGAAAVATAVAPRSHSAAAVAAHLLQHPSRSPHLPHPPRFERFGVSYTRAVLERYGPFPGDIAVAEDVVVNGRLLEAGVEIEWAPDVVSLVGYPSAASAVLREQFIRGRRFGAAAGHLGWRALAAGQVFWEAGRGIQNALASGSRLGRRELGFALPLLTAGAFATAAGRCIGDRRANGYGLHAANARRRNRVKQLRAAAAAPRKRLSRAANSFSEMFGDR